VDDEDEGEVTLGLGIKSTGALRMGAFGCGISWWGGEGAFLSSRGGSGGRFGLVLLFLLSLFILLESVATEMSDFKLPNSFYGVVGEKFGTKFLSSVGDHLGIFVPSFGPLGEDLEEGDGGGAVEPLALGSLGIDTLLRVHRHCLLLKLHDIVQVEPSHISLSVPAYKTKLRAPNNEVFDTSELL
jgi:hypothetical protein